VLSDAPDLVLSDWNMPNMTGIESLRAIRAAGSDVTFGFVTSEGSEEMRATAAEAGAAFLIAKPFTPESFRETIEPFIA
jgi:two-component system, chemotaxis family, chemotaxis protein CheY